MRSLRESFASFLAVVLITSRQYFCLPKFLKKYRTAIIFTAVFILSLSVYLQTVSGSDQNHYVWLANAFLHGKLSVPNIGRLVELIPHNGNYYVVYPPMPAVVLMPFVAIFGVSFNEALVSIIFASLATALIWLMLKKIGCSDQKSIWLSVLFGFGTCLLFTASVGSSWYIAEVCAALFLVSAIVLVLYQKSYFLVGLFLGFATISELPLALTFPFFLLLMYERNSFWAPRLKQALYFFVGLALPVCLYFAYNTVRYGSFSFFDPGYNLLTINDPNFPYGLYSILYLPKQIYAILFQGPILLSHFPYFKPSWMGLGLFFTTPAFLYIFKGSYNRLSKYAAVAVLCVLPAFLFHGTVGFNQFGYRFSIVFSPFLILLTANGMGAELSWKAKLLIILSVIINLWGTIAIIKYGFVT